jgi:hypothetical protein
MTLPHRLAESTESRDEMTKDAKEKRDLKDEEKKLKPQSECSKDADATKGIKHSEGTKGSACECDDTPAEAGEGKRADDAATEELDEKAGKKTSNDSGALAGPKTKPTIRHIDPEEEKQ